MGTVLALTLGVGGIFAALMLAMSALGLLDDGPGGVARSLAAIASFGTTPVEQGKQLEPEPSFNERVIAPLMAKIVVLGRKLTPADNAARIRHKLDVAGNPDGWTVDRVVSLKVVGMPVGLLAGFLLTGYLGVRFLPRLAVCVGAAFLGYLGVNIWLHQRGTARTEQMQKDLPDAIDLLTISVEAGLGFDAAMAQVARNTEGPISAEIARLLQEMQIGMARSQAMRALGNRTSLPELRGFANAMAQADAFGIPVGKVLRVQSTEMRHKRRQRAEEQAQKVAVKVLFPLMFCILPTLFMVVLGPIVINLLANLKAK